MIIDEIKNSIKTAISEKIENLIFHFDEIKYTGFPFVFLELKDFKVEVVNSSKKKFYSLKFEITYMKEKENKPIELFSDEEMFQEALLPCLKVGEKKLCVDNPEFKITDKKLVMNFELNFYTNEKDDEETMQILDFNIKENKNV